MFTVQRKQCATCIFRDDNPLDLDTLLAAVSDGYGGFRGHRICHHSKDACCAAFWSRYKDKFPIGQIAQRLDLVEFVDDDVLERASEGCKKSSRKGVAKQG